MTDPEERIYTKRKPETAGLPMFATQSVEERIGPPPASNAHPSLWLDWYARAAQGDKSEPLRVIVERTANVLLDVAGTVRIWECRVALGKIGLLANDGTEPLDSLGGVLRGMGLKAIGNERPPVWAMQYLKASHGNRGTIWRRMTADERANAGNRR